MSDPRMRAGGIKEMTDGSYWVDVELTFTIDGNKISIADKTNQPIGDACAALHHAALSSIGAQILEQRNTDAYQDKPEDPGAIVRGEQGLTTKR
jgi:hypothetical protein